MENTDNTTLEPSETAIHRIAWGVMLIAFATFIFACILSTLATYNFLFQSNVPMTVIAQNSQGVLALVGSDFNRQLVDGSRQLVSGNTAAPADALSQSVITIRDPYDNDRTIATITLSNEVSSATLRTASRPRFDFASIGYFIQFVAVTGDIDVYIADGLDNDISLDLVTEYGIRVKLNASGRYNLTSDEVHTVVKNHSGSAVLVVDSASVGWDVPRNQALRISHDTDIPEALPLATNLVKNNYFDEWLPEGDRLLVDWGCSSEPVNAMPNSRYQTALADGRSVIQFVRGDSAQNNRETGCQQIFRSENADYVDITNFSSIILRLAFNVDYQSLSTCGFVGTECPLMVRIKYVTDSDSDDHELVFGFFYHIDPLLDYPMRCSSCFQPHVLVKQDVWYTYESENLIDIFPEGEQPIGIKSIRFYASGHEYNLLVDEVSLLAREGEKPTEEPSDQLSLSG